MARDFLVIGGSPCFEDCAQTGSDDYYQRSLVELKAFIAQLRRKFGPEPGNARLCSKAFPHDFGTYYEVVIYYDADDEEQVEYAFKLESETPEYWDEEARKVIGMS